MKFLLYLFYFFRSVKGRGFLNTLRLLRAEMVQEKRYGIHTAAIKKSSSPEFFHYQGASYLVLLTVLKELVVQTPDFDFVDIGCGKGRALFVAEHCGYRHVTGIELDAGLLGEAQENKRHYLLKHAGSTIDLVQANALAFDYKNRPAVYFLFNPFNEEVLRNVLKRIRKSTTAETWFVYMNPLFPKPFEEQGSGLAKEFKTQRYLEALVYRWEGTR